MVRVWFEVGLGVHSGCIEVVLRVWLFGWGTLIEGGEEGQCGCLKDRFGFSRARRPAEMEKLLTDPDAGRAQRSIYGHARHSEDPPRRD